VNLGGELTFPVPSQRVARYKPYVGRTRLLFGLRPEHIIERRRHLEPEQHAFDVRVEVVEPMGLETLVYFALGGTEVCGRVSPDAAPHDAERMSLVADLGKMHLIDDSSGAVI
jgi:multiple sugar transport system ATP-binding protein